MYLIYKKEMGHFYLFFELYNFTQRSQLTAHDNKGTLWNYCTAKNHVDRSETNQNIVHKKKTANDRSIHDGTVQNWRI